MKRKARLTAALMVVCLVACREEIVGPGALTVVDLEGRWVASIYRFTNRANPLQVADIIERGGAFSVTISPDGGYDGSITWPGEQPEPVSGTLLKQGNRFLFDRLPAGSSEGDFTASITLAGGTRATITTEDVVLEAGDLDFTNDGASEISTRLIIVLDRQ